jgi:hypothetical protein
MKTNLYLCLFSALIVFNSCNSNETYTKYENHEFVDCYEVGNECLSLVNENKDELKEIFIREMERNPNDNDVTLQRTLDAFNGYQFSSKFDKYQNILKENCPEQFKKVNEEIAMIIVGEIIEEK